MTQVTIGPPLRETPGFGCPACSKPLPVPVVARDLTHGLRCCGYRPSDAEARRWIAAAEVIREQP